MKTKLLREKILRYAETHTEGFSHKDICNAFPEEPTTIINVTMKALRDRGFLSWAGTTGGANSGTGIYKRKDEALKFFPCLLQTHWSGVKRQFTDWFTETHGGTELDKLKGRAELPVVNFWGVKNNSVVVDSDE